VKLSVALCTFNGEQFLAEQLESFSRQTRLPDELIIRDDGSSDSTVALIRAYAERAPFPIRVEINQENLGSTSNFARTIALCAGDAIVLADQDDVWLPHKLETLERAFLAAPDAGFVFSDAEVVDEQLNPLGYTLWEAIRFAAREQDRFRDGQAFEALLRRYRVTGATMAFRACYRDLVLPIPSEWVHDAWIALVISAVAPCALIADSLVRYRQHGRQQHGGAKRGLFGQYLAAREMTRERCEAVAGRYTLALERLQYAGSVTQERLVLLGRKIEHYRQRSAMRQPQARRTPVVLREIWRGNYSRFSLGWKAIAQDMLLR